MALNNPSSTNITVEVYDTNITATSKVYMYIYRLWWLMKWSTFIGGVDYEPGPYSVTLLAGNTVASFYLSIFDNILFEGNEDLILTINSSSLPSHVTINDTLQTTTLIIIDDDGKVVHA